MSAVYSINNSLFASKDLIFGWCFWNEGTTPSPVAELDDAQIVALIKAFSGPLHGDIREALLAEQTARTPAADSESRPAIEVYGDFSGIADGALALRTSGFKEIPELGNEPEGQGAEANYPESMSIPMKGYAIDYEAMERAKLPPVESAARVHMKNFTMPTARTYMVTGQVVVGGELSTLLMLFSNTWMPIPGSHSDFFIRGRGPRNHIQITMHQDENDVPEYFSVHVGDEFDRFRVKYMAGECDNAKRYPLGDDWCMGNRVVAALKEEGVW